MEPAVALAQGLGRPAPASSNSGELAAEVATSDRSAANDGDRGEPSQACPASLSVPPAAAQEWDIRNLMLRQRPEEGS